MRKGKRMWLELAILALCVLAIVFVLRRFEENTVYQPSRQMDALPSQLGRPFEHEARLKDLLAKQAQLNACLDLDKHEAQIVDEPREPEEEAVSSAARRPTSSAPAVALAAPPAVV